MQRPLLITAWILVLAPLSWGVARSVQRSMPLFTAGASAGSANAPANTPANAISAPSASGSNVPTNRIGATPPVKP